MLLTAVTDDMRDANIKLDMPSQNELNKLERDMDKAQLEVDAAIMECANYTIYIRGIDTLKEKLGDIDESKMEATIESLSMLGVLDKMDISLKELGSVPVDAQKEYLEIGCEGILGAIGDFITKIVEAILKSIAAVFKFVAKVFGFDVGSSSSGGSGRNSKVDKVVKKQQKLWTRLEKHIDGSDSDLMAYKPTDPEDIKIHTDVERAFASHNISEIVNVLSKSNVTKKTSVTYRKWMSWKVYRAQVAAINAQCADKFSDTQVPFYHKYKRVSSELIKPMDAIVRWGSEFTRSGKADDGSINMPSIDVLTDTLVDINSIYTDLLRGDKNQGKQGFNVILGHAGSESYVNMNGATKMIDGLAIKLTFAMGILRSILPLLSRPKSDPILDRTAPMGKAIQNVIVGITAHLLVGTKLTTLRTEAVAVRDKLSPIVKTLLADVN